MDRTVADFDVMCYALKLLRIGVLHVDSRGRIWRRKVRHRGGFWRHVKSRRAESPGGNGYLRVMLGIPGSSRTKAVSAHRLIWTAMNGPIPDDMQINHKDLDKRNNRIDNIELMTNAACSQHAYASGKRRMPWADATHWRGQKRISSRKKVFMLILRQEGRSCQEVANALGMKRSRVYLLCYQERKRCRNAS